MFNMTDEEILDQVLEEFAHLAAIPRQSGHEAAVSAFLRDYLTAAGFAVVQDEMGNIIADRAASQGFESAPLTILQAHMDMVCVAEEGYQYNPLTDPIKLVRDESFLTAAGTSLGSDDGMGIAEGIFLLKHMEGCGPLRLIVTVDEECGMTGSLKLDFKHLQDASYLINCDSEDYDELTVGSAGSVNLRFVKKRQDVAATKHGAWKIILKGLRGGHSGERIGDGRGNAIKAMAELLDRLLQKEPDLELASFNGGRAPNVIPSEAEAVVVTDLAQDDIEAATAEIRHWFVTVYGVADPEIVIEIREQSMPQVVLSQGARDGLLQLIRLLHTGVYAMSNVAPGLVETSANLGVISTDEDEIALVFFPRSAIDYKVSGFARMAEDLAKLTGFTLIKGEQHPGWQENPASRLAKIMPEIFARQNPGKTMRVTTIHAGLECGFHFQKNPRLDIVSIGPTTRDIHSPKETLVLATVVPQVKLIAETLKRIAEA